MGHCIVCHFDVDLDDVALTCAHGHVICLRCWARETGNDLVMPRVLRREMAATLAELQGGPAWMDK